MSDQHDAAEIAAVCAGARTGESKIPVDEIELVVDYGVAGDAHGGSQRQVSLLSAEAVDTVHARHPDIGPGSYAENLLLRGLDPAGLPVGARLRVGDAALVEITQIGKKCHHACAIRTQVGSCIMPTKGVFARVLAGGKVRPGDPVRRVA